MRGVVVGRRRRRLGAWALAGMLVGVPASALVVLPAGPAYAELTSLPGTMSTAAQNTSGFTVHVPAGVAVSAVNGVVTQDAVVAGGTITFRINGAVRSQVPSALYQKVQIPVTQADVIADGTIALTMTTEGPAAAGATCIPSGGVAAVRKLELEYTGVETAPTTLADFFPDSSPGISVVIPEDADNDTILAGLTAVTALTYRYGEDAPVNLTLNAPAPEVATAGARVVALVPGEGDQVTTAISTTSGIPMLTFTGTGDALAAAARTLSADTLGLSGSQADNPSLETKPRNTDTTRTFSDLDFDSLTLTGYGSTTREFELRQDSFGVPVDAMELHLEGTHTAFSDSSGARLDIRANGSLIGSVPLGSEASFSRDVTIPASSIRSVNELTLTLNALAPDGSACSPPSIPPAEVDIDTGGSTVTVSHGTGQTRGFQLFPQIFEGTVPVALRANAGRESSAAVNAAALLSVLQRAAGSPLSVQLVEPDAFLAGDRSGLMVGAIATDSEALDAPLKLGATRLLDRSDSVEEVTSQDPYAVLESIDRNDRLVLMLGSWAPGNLAAPGELARRVVDAVVSTGWAGLDGDLVIADTDRPAFVTASRSLVPEPEVEEEKSYAKWFVLVIGVLLVLLALQVFLAIRRDRRLSRQQEDDAASEPSEEEYEVDALGDVDDLEVHENTEPRPAEPGPVAKPQPAPVVVPEREQVAEAEPEPVVEPQPVVDPEPAPEPEPEPETVVTSEPVVAPEPEPQPAPAASSATWDDDWDDEDWDEVFDEDDDWGDWGEDAAEEPEADETVTEPEAAETETEPEAEAAVQDEQPAATPPWRRLPDAAVGDEDPGEDPGEDPVEDPGEDPGEEEAESDEPEPEPKPEPEGSAPPRRRWSDQQAAAEPRDTADSTEVEPEPTESPRTTAEPDDGGAEKAGRAPRRRTRRGKGTSDA